MKILKQPGHEILWLSERSDTFRMYEGARVCYKSTPKDKEALFRRLVERDHESPFEHSSMTIRFICDRGVSHELVRHRLASFSQESTRYCNYSKDKFGREITVIKPVKIPENCLEYDIWKKSCEQAEAAYFALLEQGVTPENARSVLPTCLKTEIIVTANLREWYHIFDLRTARGAHPDMRFMMQDLLMDIHGEYPFLLDDLFFERQREFVEDFCFAKEMFDEKKGESNV